MASGTNMLRSMSNLFEDACIEATMWFPLPYKKSTCDQSRSIGRRMVMDVDVDVLT